MDVSIPVVQCLWVLIIGLSLVNGSCPPVNSRECIKFADYSDRQYARCVTDSYMKKISGNRYHHCEDRTATYCWYQCMLERHDRDHGEVTDDCLCSQLNTTANQLNTTANQLNTTANQLNTTTNQLNTTANPLNTTANQLNKTACQDLPEECCRPSGDNCDWYAQCLEKRYQCKDDPASYAIEFAQRFCLLYDTHYTNFSYAGQSWIDAVRKCLQKRLVPVLDPGQEKTCAQLRDFAFDTHASCYVSPLSDNEQNSVCDLPVADYKKVFWTISEGFLDLGFSKSAGILRQTLAQVYSVASNCDKVLGRRVKEEVIELLVDFGNRHRKERSVPDMGTAVEDVVSKLTSQIATTMRWEENTVMWFGYPVSVHNINDTGNSILIVRIMLASKGMYDLNAVNVSIVNVSSSIQGLSDAIVKGDLNFNLGKDIHVTLFKVCSDIFCTNSTFETVPHNYNPYTKYNADDNSSLLRNVLIGCSVGVVLCIIGGVVLYKLRK